jgi:hypothetical protein
VHLLKSAKAGGNPVQTYLDTLSLSQVFALKQEIEGALEQCEDSSRCMTAYQGGDDLLPRVRKHCFSKNGTPLRPHKQDDMLKKLHARLGCYNFHHIPIGFYYAKWSEKLNFHLGGLGLVHFEDAHSNALTSTESQPTRQRSGVTKYSTLSGGIGRINRWH